MIKKRGDIASARGSFVANPGDPVDKQIDDAYSTKVARTVSPDRNDHVCEAVEGWLRHAIKAFPSKAELDLLKGGLQDTVL